MKISLPSCLGLLSSLVWSSCSSEVEQARLELRASGYSWFVDEVMDPATGLPKRIVHKATGAELALIPAGEFLMGSPESEEGRISDERQHRRVIRKPFYLGVTEVTQAQWNKVMGSNPSFFMGNDQLPVDRVSWNDCQEFLQKAGGGLRLPSEAEWEYACRAGTTTPFSFGATITPEQVNYDRNLSYDGASKGLFRFQTVNVGSLPANGWGLHEMHGNVSEWCEDGYGDYPSEGTEEPSRAAEFRVQRGGSWLSDPPNCRAANRSLNVLDVLVESDLGLRSVDVGFRLARTLPE